jgi:hypothetical protein
MANNVVSAREDNWFSNSEQFSFDLLGDVDYSLIEEHELQMRTSDDIGVTAPTDVVDNNSIATAHVDPLDDDERDVVDDDDDGDDDGDSEFGVRDALAVTALHGARRSPILRERVRFVLFRCGMRRVCSLFLI